MSRILNPRDQAELGTRAALASMLIFYGVALFIGIEVILGAFLSGMLFSATFKERGPMMEKLNPLGYGFLIPIFFIYQGFEVSILEIDWIAFILLIFMTLVAFLAKIIPLALSRYFRHHRSDLAGAVLLGTNLSVVVAGVKIGGEAGILDEELSSILILYGVISCVLFPMVFRWIQKRYMSDLLER
jgi:Kef-type K+ transport system membrane component KefB